MVFLQALQYARAASIARACAYKIGAFAAEQDLPFVASNARIIGELAKSGTCVELEAFRCSLLQSLETKSLIETP